VLPPQAVDLNILIKDMLLLLAHSLGEHIEVRLRVEGGNVAMADQAQLESALLNLVLNARDAMPTGGVLTIEACNVTIVSKQPVGDSEIMPGTYVRVTVRDTGCGMPPDVLRRAFDPFFTTKETGKGTGLGLSMVRAFVKQSGGHIEVESQDGAGTAVRFYLPNAPAHGSAPIGDLCPAALPRGQETILLVEDDQDVLIHLGQILAGLGYTVVQATDGPKALRMMEDAGPIDLIVTDVVMAGGMSGNQLALEARRRHPGMKVLLISGHAEDSILRCRQFEPPLPLLRKPLHRRELADGVRTVLDGSS
jgi:CheY-like chemotaxis protein/DNA-binding transcriptional regulator YdaS (Cro superfamily)